METLQQRLLTIEGAGDGKRAEPSKPPLRVGVLIDSWMQPRWCGKVLEQIKASTFANLVWVIRIARNDRSNGDGPKMPWLFRAYRWFDDRLFDVSPDAFQSASVEPLLADCGRMRIDWQEPAKEKSLPDTVIQEIQQQDLDVIIAFGFNQLQGRALTMAKHGIWNVNHAGEGPAGFWEVLEGRSTTPSMIRMLGDNGMGDKIIYQSRAMTDPRSMKVNRNNLYWKSCRFVERKLRELHERGPDALQQPDLDTNPSVEIARGVPTNGEMLSLLCSFGRRFVAAKTNRFLRWDQWVLGYQIHAEFRPDSLNLSQVKKIVPPRDRFWADPYPVKKNGKYFIFLEELIYQERRGHLAVMEMNPDGSYQAPVKIVERPYHLSNPSVFQFQGTYYMIPETSRNKTLELYRCVEFPDRWELDTILMENVKAVDATVVEHEGRWWMFTNLADEEVSDNYDELYLFYADSPRGPWQPHPLNPIKSDVRSARPAGRLFRWNGEWYRPAQDCSRRYGYSIVIHKIVRWNTQEYQEVEVSKVLPQWSKNLVGTHTLNHCEGLTVVDGFLRRPKLF
jgi:hypothetical protein